MAAVGGRLYVLGGCDCMHIEMYDNTTDQFTVVAHMPVQKYFTNAVVTQSKILLLGGYDLRMVVYDTDTNKATVKKTQMCRKYVQSHVALLTR